MTDIDDFLDFLAEYQPPSALDTNSTLTGRNHPDTSFAAAENALGRTARTRRAVLMAICAEPSTDEELQDRLIMPPNTQRPRRRELVCDLYVRESGNKRPTRTGNDAIVWEATAKGHAAIRWEVTDVRDAG